MSTLLSIWGLYHQQSIAHGSLVYDDILVCRLKSMIGADVLQRQNGAMREIGKSMAEWGHERSRQVGRVDQKARKDKTDGSIWGTEGLRVWRLWRSLLYMRGPIFFPL